MKKLITTLVFVTAAQAFAGEIEDRLDELEMSDSLDYIRINGYLATRWDNITLGKADSLSESGEDDLSFNIHTIRLAMDFFAPVSDDFEIHVRLAGAKLTNHYGVAANWGKIHTETGSKSDLSNNMYFERAFFNYKITDSFIFSAGRLPTVDGPPYHFTLNTPAQGTYPRLLYGLTLDGYALTYGIGNLTIRGIYHPLNSGTSYSGNFSYPKFKPYQSTLSKTHGDERWANTNIDMNSVMLEYNDSFSFARNFQAILQTFSFENFTNTDGRSLTNTGTSADGVISGSNLTFSYNQYVLYLGFEGLFGTKANFAVSHSITNSESSGDILNDVPSRTIGFLTNKTEDSNSGAGTLISASYGLPIESLSNPSLSLEFMSSDKYYNFWDVSAEDPVGFYTNRGSGMKITYIQPLKSGFSARLGYISSNQKYSSGFGGEPSELDGVTNSNIFLEFRAQY